MQSILMIITGLIAGIASGLFGIGGGIIIVPALVLICRFSQLTANATSMVALLLPVGTLGVLEYYKDGKITLEHIKLGLLIALGIFFGALVGVKLANMLPEDILRKMFSVFLVVVALRIWFGEK